MIQSAQWGAWKGAALADAAGRDQTGPPLRIKARLEREKNKVSMSCHKGTLALEQRLLCLCCHDLIEEVLSNKHSLLSLFC